MKRYGGVARAGKLETAGGNIQLYTWIHVSLSNLVRINVTCGRHPVLFS